MRKTNLLLVILFLISNIASSQNSISNSASQNIEISSEQKQFLQNTWYESPTESSGNKIVYLLTEYVVVVGKDDFNYPPGKLILNADKTYNSEYLKVIVGADPVPAETGTWTLKNNLLLLKANATTKEVSIISIDNQKLIVKIK